MFQGSFAYILYKFNQNNMYDRNDVKMIFRIKIKIKLKIE